MNKYEKRVLGFIVAVLVIFLVFDMVGVSKTSNRYAIPLEYETALTEPGIEKVNDSLYNVNMLAQMWSFEPLEVYVPVGAEIVFNVSSRDVTHGFHMASKGINFMVIPGTISQTSATFDKPGIYPIICHEYCGTGTQHMQAEIIVNHPRETN